MTCRPHGGEAAGRVLPLGAMTEIKRDGVGPHASQTCSLAALSSANQGRSRSRLT
jgi:hypothetical protein